MILMLLTVLTSNFYHLLDASAHGKPGQVLSKKEKISVPSWKVKLIGVNLSRDCKICSNADSAIKEAFPPLRRAPVRYVNCEMRVECQ